MTEEDFHRILGCPLEEGHEGSCTVPVEDDPTVDEEYRQ